jgi:hypothetical protein
MSRKRRSLKILGLALVASLAFAAFAAAAQAHEWKKNGTVLTSPESVSCEGGPWMLINEIGGIPIILEATKVSCNPGSTIFNSGGEAKDNGSLTFDGVTVASPPIGCEVHNEQVVTEELDTTLIEGPNGHAYDLFVPGASAEGLFAVVEIEGCVLEGNDPVTGSVAGEGNEFGVEEAKQPLVYGPAQDAAIAATAEAHTGEPYGLKFGIEPATLEGTATNFLPGGGVFGASAEVINCVRVENPKEGEYRTSKECIDTENRGSEGEWKRSPV